MPLQLTTQPPVPNAVYLDQILLQTAIVNGRLITSANVSYVGCRVENQGEENEAWQRTGPSGTLYIGDIANLEDDLKSLSPSVLQVMGGILQLAAQANVIKKIL